MESKDRLQPLFDSVDRHDVEAFLAFLSEDATFRFGNAEPVKGKSAIRDVLQGFFSSIKGLHHDVRDAWDAGDALICHGIASYTRHDSSTLAIPFAVILKMKGDLIGEYLIFLDASQLYENA
ncbi:MAG: nuclear transport factor 2 family protein [Sedimentisphaerales bacterium]|jgi:ketosteroid isomerase-like protein